jgi:hypothetical protein
MITTAINEAMRPYSMAVTPVSSVAKRNKRVLTIIILDSGVAVEVSTNGISIA